MKEVTRNYEVYDYEELDVKAKEKAKQWYLDNTFREETLTEIFEEDLTEVFPESNLKVQWSLSNCQGDGVNIYGELHLDDILTLPEKNYFDFLEKYKGYFTEKEKRTIKFYTSFCENNEGFILPENRNYCYCNTRFSQFGYEMACTLEDACIKNINMLAIKKWEKYIVTIIEEICSTWEKMGYDYLYDEDDEIIQENCKSNEWYFLKDGTFFNL